MDILTLKVFVTVAREGSLTRAAEKMHLTQPAVGLQIKKLQDHSGLQLFTRTPHGMTLTLDGAKLLPLADKVVSAQQEFNAVAARMNSDVQYRLSVGTIVDPEFIRLGAFLKELVGVDQHIEIKLQHGMSGEVFNKVVRGELDAGFYLDLPGMPGSFSYDIPPIKSTQPPGTQADLQVKTLTHFAYRVVAPSGWASLVQGRDWKELALLPWLATPPASVHHRLLSSVFGPESLTGVDFNRVAMVDQEASMLDLVKSGICLSLVREHIAFREAQARELVIVEGLSLDCALSFVCLKQNTVNPAIKAALKALESIWH